MRVKKPASIIIWINKGLLKRYTVRYCFCVMKVNRRMMVISALKGSYVRKSILPALHQMQRVVNLGQALWIYHHHLNLLYLLANLVKRQENGMFSVGQSLRIRVGPLKGYLCRVLAVRRSDVTVKLDSQKKILTVKCEHLSEVRGRNPAISQGEDSGTVKPFDFLQTQDGASETYTLFEDWMGGATLSTEGNNWYAGGSTESNYLNVFNLPIVVKPVGGKGIRSFADGC